MTKTKLILIAGPSGSGKSTLAAALRSQLGVSNATILPMDAYYRDMSHLAHSERAKCNFDHPDSLEWHLLISHINKLMSGETVHVPVYSFADHARCTNTQEYEPAPWLVLEGIHALFNSSIRARASLSVYMDAARDTCLKRRLDRDLGERGRTPECVRIQFDSQVWPMALEWVLPQKNRADCVIPETLDLELATAKLMDRLLQIQRTSP
ncbi:MAG: uridine kinase [Candidatus Hydrogenedentota bacterium]